jgi:hypothetical protein
MALFVKFWVNGNEDEFLSLFAGHSQILHYKDIVQFLTLWYSVCRSIAQVVSTIRRLLFLNPLAGRKAAHMYTYMFPLLALSL